MFWMYPPTPKPPQYVIHIVSGGRTLCGVATYYLKKNERWVEPKGDDVHLANCENCIVKRKP